MTRRRSAPVVASYVITLVLTVTLLVWWVVYVVRSTSRINELAGRVGVSGESTPWIILALGCALFILVIVGVTWQLAQSLAARRYVAKQEQFVSNMTHEMKSPLAAIKLHAQTLEAEVSPEEQQRSVGFVLEQVERLSTLVDNILESSRQLAGKQVPGLRPLALEPFFSGYREGAEAHAALHGVRLATRLATNSIVLASPEALERVMSNLLDNALRFSATGGEVRLSVADQGAVVQIEVADDGIGIPKRDLDRVFDRFYQIDGPRETRQGTGLGLSIVRGLVREMRGTVRAQSQEGRPGARFVVELPILDSAA